ncbi:MAG: GGDEF domain-containing protein [Trueperaceae bacterium]
MTRTQRELERERAHFERQAGTDVLTGLANRQQVLQALSAEIARAARNDTRLAVLLLDVDRFKEVNDAFGHPAGDAVLRAVAEILTSESRSYDVVARLGGDEFLCLLPDSEPNHVEAFGQRIADRVRAVRLSEAPTPLTISVGVVRAAPNDDPSSVLSRVDVALYDAKRAGRDRVHLGEAP